MVFKRMFSAALVAMGLSLALPAHADVGTENGPTTSQTSGGKTNIKIDLRKGGSNTESARMRGNFGQGNKYRGSREASRLQKPDEIDHGKHQIGGTIAKVGSDATKDKELHNECDLKGKGPGATVSAKIGTQSNDEAAHSKARGVAGSKFGCNVGVEATLVGVKGGCQKQLAGDENLGLGSSAEGSAVLGGGASCSCQGLTYAGCEAFIGVKADGSATLDGQLCGLSLGVGVEGGVGAGLGAKVAGGKSSRGFGFSFGLYAGVGGNIGVAINPDLSKLIDSKTRGEVLACLKQKALASLGWLGNLLSKIAPPATNGGDAFMMP